MPASAPPQMLIGCWPPGPVTANATDDDFVCTATLVWGFTTTPRHWLHVPMYSLRRQQQVPAPTWPAPPLAAWQLLRSLAPFQRPITRYLFQRPMASAMQASKAGVKGLRAQPAHRSGLHAGHRVPRWLPHNPAGHREEASRAFEQHSASVRGGGASACGANPPPRSPAFPSPPSCIQPGMPPPLAMSWLQSGAGQALAWGLVWQCISGMLWPGAPHAGPRQAAPNEGGMESWHKHEQDLRAACWRDPKQRPNVPATAGTWRKAEPSQQSRRLAVLHCLDRASGPVWGGGQRR